MTTIDLTDAKAVDLVAAYHEAERCVAIYDTPFARAHPAAAWTMLPLGLPVAKAIEAINTMEPETRTPAGFHRDRLSMLTLRRDIALARWREYQMETHLHERLN